MTNLQIDTQDRILIDGQAIGLSVRQESTGTVVYVPGGQRIPMGHRRYSLTTNRPAKGVGGADTFEEEIRKIMAA